MSSSKETYVGIVITVPEITKETKVLTGYRICQKCNTKCKTLYCGNCGTQTVEEIVDKKAPKDLFEFIYSNKLDMFRTIPDCDTKLILNISCNYNLSSDKDILLDNDFETYTFINSFEDDYKKELELICSEYQDIKISFGIINY